MILELSSIAYNIAFSIDLFVTLKFPFYAGTNVIVIDYYRQETNQILQPICIPISIINNTLSRHLSQWYLLIIISKIFARMNTTTKQSTKCRTYLLK